MNGYFCGKCGTPAGAEDVFCHRCGMELNVQAAPSTDYAASQRKICPQCGESVPMGDRFCGKCGTGQVTPGFNAQIHTKKRAMPSGVTTHRRKRGFLLRLISALMFWGIVIGAFYGVYKFLGNGIPWSEVMALVASKEEPRTVGMPVTESAGGISESMPPIVPETSGSGDLPVTPEPIRAEPLQPSKPEWGAQDANGYSVLILPGQEGAGVSRKGAVRGNRVRLRAEPNTRSQILGQFDSGKEFDVTGRYWSGNERYFWYGVSSGGDSGWMYGEYIRMEEE